MRINRQHQLRVGRHQLRIGLETQVEDLGELPVEDEQQSLEDWASQVEDLACISRVGMHKLRVGGQQLLGRHKIRMGMHKNVMKRYT